MVLRRVVAGALVAIAVLVTIAPIVTMVVLSFCGNRFPALPWPGWSLVWYRELLMDAELHASLVRSVAVGATTAAISVVLGFGSGLFLSRIPFMKAVPPLLALSLPALFPVILVAFSFMDFARMLGVSRSLIGVTLVHTVIFSPIATAIFFQRLSQLNPEIEDAAWELGGGEWIILSIIVGQVKRAIVAVFIIVFVLSWDEYIVAALVSGFGKTYPVQVRTMLEATFSPEVYAVGALVAVSSLTLVSLAVYLQPSWERER